MFLLYFSFWKNLLNFFSKKGYLYIYEKINNSEELSIISHFPNDYKNTIGERIAIDLFLKKIKKLN